MMRNAMILLAIFCVSASVSAQGWTKEPVAFRSVPWGASEAEARKIVAPGSAGSDPFDEKARFVCRDSAEGTEERVCRDDVTLLGHIPVEEKFHFWQGKFSAVHLGFVSQDAEAISDLLVSEYGTTMADEKTTDAANCKRRARKWSGPTVTIELYEIFGEPGREVRPSGDILRDFKEKLAQCPIHESIAGVTITLNDYTEAQRQLSAKKRAKTP